MKAKIKKTVLYGLLFMASKWCIIALLYSSGHWSYWFLLLFPVADTIAAITAILYLRNNFRGYFKKTLEASYPDNFKDIIKSIESKNDILNGSFKFALKSKNPLDKKLPFAAYFLAMIQVLEAEKVSFDKIKTLCLEVAEAYAKPKNRIHKWYKLLLPKLMNSKLAKPFINRLHKKSKELAHLDGFKAHFLRENVETLGFGYGFDVLDCGICKLFKKHQMDRYATILCEVDKVTSGFSGMELIRTGTIANGAHKCDFRYQKN
ncbi:MAG: hypothetical protein ACI9IP_002095 [Arcticibacterium sp.]|jgi:hypothetical protein